MWKGTAKIHTLTSQNIGHKSIGHILCFRRLRMSIFFPGMLCYKANCEHRIYSSALHTTRNLEDSNISVPELEELFPLDELTSVQSCDKFLEFQEFSSLVTFDSRKLSLIISLPKSAVRSLFRRKAQRFSICSTNENNSRSQSPLIYYPCYRRYGSFSRFCSLS